MDSNNYELDQFISLQVSHPTHYKYSVIHINIYSEPDKFIKLKPFFAGLVIEESKIKFDFILLCETFLTNTNFDLNNIVGYNLVCKNRKHMKASGVGMYVSDR